MPIALRRARVARVAVTFAGIGLATSTAVVAAAGAPASAYVPASDLAGAVRNERSAIAAADPGLYQRNFQSLNGNPDGLSGPDGTPDGRGAFQFYRGTAAWGAVYAHRSAGGLRVGSVYGAILDSWRASGWELGPFGYPVGRERNAGSVDVRRGCLWGDRAQTFDKDENVWTACWNAGTGVQWHRGGIGF